MLPFDKMFFAQKKREKEKECMFGEGALFWELPPPLGLLLYT
jgi:hypothetical protein